LQFIAKKKFPKTRQPFGESGKKLERALIPKDPNKRLAELSVIKNLLSLFVNVSVDENRS
jgi:hypothetical protein